jgi:hypothetical protein
MKHEDDTLQHQGVKGMHWGIHKSVKGHSTTNKKLKSHLNNALKSTRKSYGMSVKDTLNPNHPSYHDFHKDVSSGFDHVNNAIESTRKSYGMSVKDTLNPNHPSYHDFHKDVSSGLDYMFKNSGAKPTNKRIGKARIMLQNDNQDDKLQHWGIKGMEWKHHKKSKKEEEIKKKLSALIKQIKSKSKNGAKTAKKVADKIAKETKPVAKDIAKKVKKEVGHGKTEAVKIKKQLGKKIRERSSNVEKPKVKTKSKDKNTKYTMDFVAEAKKNREKASNALSKKRTSEGRKEQQSKASTLKKAWENEHWKNLTNEVRAAKKDEAVNDHWEKVNKDKVAKAASKDKAVNDYWKKVKKAKAAQGSRTKKKAKAVKDYWKNIAKEEKARKHNDKTNREAAKRIKAREAFRKTDAGKAQAKNDKKNQAKLEAFINRVDKKEKKPNGKISNVRYGEDRPKKKSKKRSLIDKLFGPAKKEKLTGTTTINGKSPREIKAQIEANNREITNPSGEYAKRLSKLSKKQNKARLKKLWKNVPDATFRDKMKFQGKLF